LVANAATVNTYVPAVTESSPAVGLEVAPSFFTIKSVNKAPVKGFESCLVTAFKVIEAAKSAGAEGKETTTSLIPSFLFGLKSKFAESIKT